ncbi:hypothetical protein M8818_006113 [Zalaria obscura]|uniref:Uncharacterized protein n=1 Tax=Zalaria obscura TaxID=2024903 RepID=A0ACC3S7W1_9PEZI
MAMPAGLASAAPLVGMPAGPVSEASVTTNPTTTTHLVDNSTQTVQSGSASIDWASPQEVTAYHQGLSEQEQIVQLRLQNSRLQEQIVQLRLQSSGLQHEQQEPDQRQSAGPGVMARMMIPREETKADGPVSGAEDTKGIRFINRG